MIRTVAIATFLGFVSPTVFPKSQLAFDVASIRPNQSGGTSGGIHTQGGTLTAENATLKQLLAYAYDVPRYQVSGPDWIAADGYDITASTKNSPNVVQFQLMLRALLEQRFELKLHRETKEIPTYLLVVVKGGPKLRDVTEEQTFFSALAGKSPFRPGFAAIFSNKSLPEFAERLGRPMDRPIIDKTGIKGRYWFELEWAYEPNKAEREPYVPASSAFHTALHEQLGLDLEDGKATVEFVVIDSAQKLAEK